MLNVYYKMATKFNPLGTNFVLGGAFRCESCPPNPHFIATKNSGGDK